MKRNRGSGNARKGAMLVLAIFFIILASSLAVLVMAGSVQLVRTTRHEHEVILLRQLTDSGKAWVHAHRGVRSDAEVTLSGKDILPEGMTGEVKISLNAALPEAITVTAKLRFSGREVSRTTRFDPAF
jgi:hypothetical protein